MKLWIVATLEIELILTLSDDTRSSFYFYIFSTDFLQSTYFLESWFSHFKYLLNLIVGFAVWYCAFFNWLQYSAFTDLSSPAIKKAITTNESGKALHAQAQLNLHSCPFYILIIFLIYTFIIHSWWDQIIQSKTKMHIWKRNNYTFP